MKLIWYGHACFKLVCEEGSIVFDPYSPGRVPGLELPPLEADMVISSHGHGDHVNPEGVKLSGRTCNIKIEQVPCFHDPEGGKLRGNNTITVVEADGLRAAHLGDLGHELSEEQYRKIGKPDVLMVPVGGFFTIDAATAAATATRLDPRFIVPMHYRKGEDGLQKIEELPPFLENYAGEDIEFLSRSVCDFNDTGHKKVIVFPWPEF